MNEFSKSKELWDYEDFLADVLGVWDCYEQRWCEDAPLVLRFEEQDIWVVKPLGDTELAVRGGLEVVAGAPVSPEESALISSIEQSNGRALDLCLCWRAVPDLSSLKGDKLFVGEAIAGIAALGH